MKSGVVLINTHHPLPDTSIIQVKMSSAQILHCKTTLFSAVTAPLLVKMVSMTVPLIKHP